jgi:NADH:ubiquinone oxidoreductase subunit 6 (subunit J)/NADH:ubiquinone oxidoreductase subunit 3 (subunit A)
MELLLPMITLKGLLPLLAIIAGMFVITTKNAIISVFNLIVLYILVAFYLIYIGVTYLGISYIIIYIGAIAILFLFIIMMIDVEVVEKRSNNYLPLLFLLLSGFLIGLKNFLYNIGLIKVNILSIEEKLYEKSMLFNLFELPGIGILEGYNQLSLIEDNIINFEYNNDDFFSSDLEKFKGIINYSDSLELLLSKSNFPKSLYTISDVNSGKNYLLITPDWDLASNRITQISAIGDVLYTVYHSYIYILSVILLLSMVGAIILTGDTYQEIKVINVTRNKNSSILLLYYLVIIWSWFVSVINYLSYKIYYKCFNYKYNKKQVNCEYIQYNYIDIIKNNNEVLNTRKLGKVLNYKVLVNKSAFIPSFSYILNTDNIYSEDIMGNLTYFILANIIIALLLLAINSYFSISVKYLDKGGGFECGFTSFVQTRERFNVIFYRVSLLFLVFDLEIILAFPYTVIYQKNQNISKNNVIAFLYILIVGFIYELKEGALNIVKKAHSTEINI